MNFVITELRSGSKGMKEKAINQDQQSLHALKLHTHKLTCTAQSTTEQH